jgi:hypothetical protein
MPNTKVDLSIVIVSFNTKDLVKACLDSIETFLAGKINFTVWVVDNNSSDDSRAMLLEYKGNHRWLETEFLSENTGFAVANNVGIRKSTGDFVLLLNSDTYLIDDSLCKAVTYLDRTPGVFGCGCCLVDRQIRPAVSFGQFPSPWTVVKEIALNKYCQLRAQVPQPDCPAVLDIDFPCGAFFLIKRKYLDKTGLLDEQFFMYCEETDLALRARRMGYKIVLLSDVRVVHVGGGSSSPDKALQQQTLLYHSWMKYTLKNHGRAAGLFLYCLLKCYFAFMTRMSINSAEGFRMHQLAFKRGSSCGRFAAASRKASD